MTDSWTDEKRKWSFWSKVIQGPNGCWLWIGSTRKNGYGSLTRKKGTGVTSTVHRFSYTELVGPIPEGHEVDHLCGVRNCVRPEHLEAVTIQENRRRRDIVYRPLVPTDERPIPTYSKPTPKNPPRRIKNGKPNPNWTPPPPKPEPTHCKNGHEYDVVGWIKNGRGRTCAACRAESSAKQKAKTIRKPCHGTETHCPHGHPYSPENTYYRKRGGRECKTCVNARNRAGHHRRAVLQVLTSSPR